jgi:hypothetical protein
MNVKVGPFAFQLAQVVFVNQGQAELAQRDKDAMPFHDGMHTP